MHTEEVKAAGLNMGDFIDKVSVPVLTTRHLFEKHGIQSETLMLLLVDTEGFDRKIVLGLDTTLVGASKFVLFEYNTALLMTRRERTSVWRPLVMLVGRPNRHMRTSCVTGGSPQNCDQLWCRM